MPKGIYKRHKKIAFPEVDKNIDIIRGLEDQNTSLRKEIASQDLKLISLQNELLDVYRTIARYACGKIGR